MSNRRILIVGGSTRAAADSVRRAGWSPICADLFADLDLRTTAEVITVRNYPASLPDDVAQVQADGWFYCGALENHPQIVERIIEQQNHYGPLLGTPPAALRLVRDPQWLMDILRAADVPVLDVVDQAAPPKPDGSWLQKPLASAGGRSIRIWDQLARQVPFHEPHYFQRRASGVGLSAIFRIEQGEFEWLGASRELETHSTSHPPSAFAYCGTCGPLHRDEVSIRTTKSSRAQFQLRSEMRHSVRLGTHDFVPGDTLFPATLEQQLTDIARTLAKTVTGLRGLIGLDFRLERDKLWLTEVNPRYTASVEVIELATGRSLLNPIASNRLAIPNSIAESHTRDTDCHFSIAIPTSRANLDSSPTVPPTSRNRVIAKQILYAESILVAPDLRCYLNTADPWQVPIIADIPVPGTMIEPGWPICTVLAEGANETDVESVLRNRVAQIRKELSNPVESAR